MQWGNGNFPITAILGAFAGLENADANLAENILNDLSGSVGQLDQAFIVNDPAVGFIDITTAVKQSPDYHQDDWAAFFKDDWNVSSNLTINYGLRWDVYRVYGKSDATGGGFDSGTFKTGIYGLGGS